MEIVLCARLLVKLCSCTITAGDAQRWKEKKLVHKITKTAHEECRGKHESFDQSTNCLSEQTPDYKREFSPKLVWFLSLSPSMLLYFQSKPDTMVKSLMQWKWIFYSQTQWFVDVSKDFLPRRFVLFNCIIIPQKITNSIRRLPLIQRKVSSLLRVYMHHSATFSFWFFSILDRSTSSTKREKEGSKS